VVTLIGSHLTINKEIKMNKKFRLYVYETREYVIDVVANEFEDINLQENTYFDYTHPVVKRMTNDNCVLKTNLVKEIYRENDERSFFDLPGFNDNPLKFTKREEA
jgi:hypothetical protein